MSRSVPPLRVLLGGAVLLAALVAPRAAYAGDPGNGTPHAGGGLTAQGVTSASVAAPSGYSVKGIDIGDSEGTVNWGTVASAGIEFSYTKATEGNGYVPSVFGQQYNGAKSAGLYSGAYDFGRPDQRGGTSEADFFLDHAAYVRDGKTLPPMLDIEIPYKNGSGVPVAPSPCYGISPSAMVSWVHDFVTEVQARTGSKTMIYTSASWWNQCTGGNTGFGDQPLFLANWNSTPGTLPAGWSTWTLWQYTDNSGVPGTHASQVDGDVFNGDLNGLAALAGATSLTGVDGSGGRVATAVHTSGQVEVFAVTATGGIRQRFESSPGGAWSDWFDFGPAGTVKAIATARHASGQVEVYAVMADGSIDNRFETAPGQPWSQWYTWAPAGTATALTAAVHVSGQVEVYAVTPTGGIRQRFESSPGGAWSDWFDFGPAGTVKAIATARHASGQVEVYAVMADGSIDNKFETAPGQPWSQWYGWAPAGTADTTGVPGTVTTGVHTSGQVEVFVVAPGGSVKQRFESTPGGAWSGWFDFGPAGTVRELAASRHASGQVEVYAVTADGSIDNKFETAPGQPWSQWYAWAPAATAA